MVTQRRRWGGMRLPLGAEEGLDTRTPTHRLHTEASVICIFIFIVVVAIWCHHHHQLFGGKTESAAPRTLVCLSHSWIVHGGAAKRRGRGDAID